ncbi:GntR family transcriptional regulator [Gymnodinialimonas hymeniacidonis]|uniref:GntR family transcriptional regulator n=1 Tax=Gymnodinialimonas hymeniacidonis TaxID=3126508 RepID=UPI0034C65DC0
MARTPLYKAAESEMIARIEKGDWEVGRRLPNEFILADEFGVSQGTMRRALITLEGRGYLSRKPGRGTLVAAKAPAQDTTKVSAQTPVLCGADGAPLALEPFRGRTATRAATASEATSMGCERVAVLERTLKYRGARAALEAVAVPVDLIPKLDEDAPANLADLLDHHGITCAAVRADARAEVTDMSQSVALSSDRHTALLVVRTAAFDASDRVIARQILRVAVEDARLVYL